MDRPESVPALYGPSCFDKGAEREVRMKPTADPAPGAGNRETPA